MGVPEIRFQYPLQTDREKDLHKKALATIALGFQIGAYWSLTETYLDTLEKCRAMSPDHPEPIFVPIDIMHGDIMFKVEFRFDGYQEIDKEKLAQKLFEGGIVPCADALDFSYRHGRYEFERVFGQIDQELLAQEQRATIARNLSFIHEE